MGLAASQARFLAITSRKMNCEFQSMRIAQDKLSVTRDLQRAAREYQNSLTQTKLVWDTNDVSTSLGTDVYDVSYGLMMTPSSKNEYNAYLVTDTLGRAVLSPSMWNAALKAGIIDPKGNPISQPTKSGRDAFLDEMAKCNLISSKAAEDIKELKQGYTASGIGGEIIDKSIANVLPTNKFISYLKSTSEKDNKPYYSADFMEKKTDSTGQATDKNLDNNKVWATGLKLFEDGKTQDEKETTIRYCTTTNPKLGKSGDNKTENTISVYNNGKLLSANDLSNLTLGDLISGKYELVGVMNQKSFEVVATKILEKFAQTLGYQPGEYSSENNKALNMDQESHLALQSAFDYCKFLLNSSKAKELTTAKEGTTAVSELNNKAKQTNGIVYNNEKTFSAVSLSNMLKSFLTEFARSMDGYDSPLLVDRDSVKKSSYVTDDLSYNFIIHNDTNETINNETILNADFYNQIYNNLCTYGACPDSIKRQNITDNNYLSNGLKNGQLFISSLNNDGYFYQGAYTLNGHVAEVEDEDAIARAEAEYNVTKNRLDYKEQELDLDLKNIDTELSALSTEFDTVKNLISKNVEKVFTMFSS